MTENQFTIGDKVVYPTHKGIGTVLSIGEKKFVDTTSLVYTIQFQKDNMVLHIPVEAAMRSGLRMINSKDYITNHVISVLRTTSTKKEEAWRNCSSEYEAKLHSGDLTLIAEIVRDLCDNGNFTYSKRNIYEAALDRLASEVSSVYGNTFEEAKQRILMIKRGLARTVEEHNISLDQETHEEMVDN